MKVLEKFIKKHISKSKRKIYNHKWRKQNKETLANKSKIYRENNKEHISKRESLWHKINNQKPKGIKKSRIADWKYKGLKAKDYNVIYNRYINTFNCDLCYIELYTGKDRRTNSRCMDHNHITGEFRAVVCCKCNNSKLLRMY